MQSPRELHLTILLRIAPCAASPIIHVLILDIFLNICIGHSASSLEALTVTSRAWTDNADSWCFLGAQALLYANQIPPRALQALAPISEQRRGCGAGLFLSLVLLAPKSSILIGELNVAPARGFRVEVRCPYVCSCCWTLPVR